MRKTIIPATRALFNVRVTHRENMPLTGPCFIFGNHSNLFDPFIINEDLTVEPTAGVMTRGPFHQTIPRIFMESIGIVPTSKYIPEPGIVRDVFKMADQKRMIVIFPEGERRWDGRPKPLIETTLKLFWKLKIPIHPVQLHGSYLGWPRWARIPRRSRIEARWLTPIHATDFDNYDSFANTCRLLIDFEEYDPPADTIPFTSWKPALGVERLLYRCPETGETGCVYSPDGVRVCSRSAGFEYRMDHASRLIDRQGGDHSLIDLFDRINRMEMTVNREGYLLRVNGSRFFTLDKNHQLIPLGQGTSALTPDGFEYSYGSESGFISLEQIHSLSVEQRGKFSITDSDRTLQFTVGQGSSLQWQLYLRRLQNGESPVRER